MPKRFFLPFVPGLLTLAAGVTGTVAGPAARTRAYFGLQREWLAHWPLEHGQFLPRAIEPAFQPMAPVWMQVEPHIRMWLDPNDYVSHEILETGKWEPTSWDAIQQHLSPGATFVDIGAHIGYYSLKAAPVVGPTGRVIAVEPNPDTIRKLRDNIRASDASVIRVEPVACSDRDATLDLFGAAEANTGETSLSRENALQAGPGVVTYHVPARRLDEILQGEGVTHVDAVKIDVEGAELQVLRGAQDTLRRYHPMIMIEIIDHQLRDMGASAQELVQFLNSQGYTARRSFGDNFEFVTTSALAETAR